MSERFDNQKQSSTNLNQLVKDRYLRNPNNHRHH